MSDQNEIQVVERPIIINTTDNTASRITITDNTTAEITVLDQVTNVTVQGMSPTVNVTYGGTRGPIYAPGMDFSQSALLAYLVNSVEKSHLNTALNTEIDATTIGLAEAKESLNELIEVSGALTTAVNHATTTVTQSQEEIAQIALRVTSVEAGNIEAVQTKLTQTADDITLAASRLDSTENSVTNAQVQLDDHSIRLTAAETSIDNIGPTVTSQMELLSNQWTLRIQEDDDGDVYAIGMGAVLYPDWAENKLYDLDEYIYFDDEVYKVLEAHMSSTLNNPTNAPELWQFIPGGVKSQIGFDAEQFYIRTSYNGTKYTPFIVQGNAVYINGNLIANGTISANAFAANQVVTWSVKSPDYISGTSGYFLDAITGIAEFNNINFNLNYLSQDDLDTGLDTDTGGLIVRNTTTSDYAHLTAGALNFMYWNGTDYDLYNTVSRIEPGIAYNNTVTYIGGIFKLKPYVFLCPAKIGTYKNSSSTTDQEIVFATNDVTETYAGSGKWKFTPTATHGTATGSSSTTLADFSSGCTSYTSYAITTVVDRSTVDYTTFTKTTNTLISTPVTASIQLVGTVAYTQASLVTIYAIIDGTQYLVSSNSVGGSGTIAVNYAKAVTSATHTVGLRIDIKVFYTTAMLSPGPVRYLGGCNYKYGLYDQDGTILVPITLNVNATASLRVISNIAASTLLTACTLNYLAIGK